MTVVCFADVAAAIVSSDGLKCNLVASGTEEKCAVFCPLILKILFFFIYIKKWWRWFGAERGARKKRKRKKKKRKKRKGYVLREAISNLIVVDRSCHFQNDRRVDKHVKNPGAVQLSDAHVSSAV